MISVSPVPAELPSHPAKENVTWEEFLQLNIIEDWRPGEFDFEHLHFIPDPSNPDTTLNLCARRGCDIRLDQSPVCPACLHDWNRAKVAGATVDKAEWMATNTRVFRNVLELRCLVATCEKEHYSQGFCNTHVMQFRAHRARLKAPELSAQEWIDAAAPVPFVVTRPCPFPKCKRAAQRSGTFCSSHKRAFKSAGEKTPGLTIAAWIGGLEPLVPTDPKRSYAMLTGIPFNALPSPLRWELLYVIQQRDADGRARLAPGQNRGHYLRLRESGRTTAVGLERFGLERRNSNVDAIALHWQHSLDEAHRKWSGLDNRDPRIIYFADLELTRSVKGPGRKARVDLRGIQLDWIFLTVAAYLRSAPLNQANGYFVRAAWMVVDEVLRARSTPRTALGRRDMAAIVAEISARVPKPETQYRHLIAIEQVMDFARLNDSVAEVWDAIPSRFVVDRVIAPGRRKPITTADGEAFRFVPQPIVDWIMDHLSLYERPGEFATVETRMIIFLLERTGRRTSELVSLRDDCISYDSSGAPYLEWSKGKPPYGPGRRLPIHQETHDVVREWQAFKKSQGIESAWLFQSAGYLMADRHYASGFLSRRVRKFAEWVAENHPYEAMVEGSTGNLIHFDITSIDAYSFRHAFAQRLADATDENGVSTTAPDVLQDFMGHVSFASTMAYYEVSVKRKKRALAAIPPRQLDFMGKAVTIDREREGFNRIAVSHGACTEPQNVLSGGHGCALNHACESCPFFLVDPLERDGIGAKREFLLIQLERSRVIRAREHILDHYVARIEDCDRIIAGIDDYILALPDEERTSINLAIQTMADVRKRASAARKIDLRQICVSAQHA